MSFADKLKHAVFTEDEKPADQPTPIPASQPLVSPTRLVPMVITSNLPVPDDSGSGYYESLVAATKPESQVNLSKLLATAHKLEDAIPDRSVRLNAAVATSEVTKASVLSDVQSLMTALQSEHDRFDQKLAAATKQAITDTQTTADNLKSELERKQQELQTLLVGIETNRNKIANRQSSFAAAFARRKAELDQMQSEFSILK